MQADVQVFGGGSDEHKVGLAIGLPVELVAYIAGGGDMEGKRSMMMMDREAALVLAEEIKRAALDA